MASEVEKLEKSSLRPSKGDRIQLLQTHLGIQVCGTVFYSDQLQILVRWDNGRSQSLRVGVDGFRIIE